MEAFAKRRPTAYRRLVYAMAAAGYLFLVLIILALLAGVVAAVATLHVVGIKVGFMMLALLWVVLRSMWVRLSPPAHAVLARAEAPELFAVLDRLQQRLDTPPFHEVQLTSDFNAGVMQIPVLGLFGWYRNYLLIGLPLLKSLTVPQFEAVLAHELGHLSRGHARVGNWIYRLRTIWAQLEEGLANSGRWGSGMLRRFYGWYIPYFQATSFPLARANEYEADAASVALTSARSAAQALTGVSVVGSLLSERYWPGVHAAAKDSPQPAFAPYADYGPAAIKHATAGETARWLELALQKRTTTADTHPSLSDRLAAIGSPAELVLPEVGESADRLLGASAHGFEAQFDERWRQGIAGSWSKYHERVQGERQRLLELRARDAAALSEAEGLQLADLETAVGSGAEAALAVRRGLRARFPGSKPVQFALAAQLLAANEVEGVALMAAVVDAEPGAELSGCQQLRDYFWRTQDKALAEQWQARYLQRATLLQGAQAERAQVTLKDGWLAHGLDAATLAQLVERLRSIPDLRRVYLARKVVHFMPERPLYIVGYRVTPWYRRRDEAAGVAAMQNLQRFDGWPGEAIIVNVEGRFYKFGRKFWRMRGARILG